MKDRPSQRNMKDAIQASYIPRGQPKYIDTTAESPQNPFHRLENINDVPAYRTSNPRYWEYR